MRGMAIAERGIGETESGFEIALSKELLQYTPRPALVQLPGLGRMGNVAGVHDQTQRLRLVDSGNSGMCEYTVNYSRTGLGYTGYLTYRTFLKILSPIYKRIIQYTVLYNVLTLRATRAYSSWS